MYLIYFSSVPSRATILFENSTFCSQNYNTTNIIFFYYSSLVTDENSLQSDFSPIIFNNVTVTGGGEQSKLLEMAVFSSPFIMKNSITKSGGYWKLSLTNNVEIYDNVFTDTGIWIEGMANGKIWNNVFNNIGILKVPVYQYKISLYKCVPLSIMLGPYIWEEERIINISIYNNTFENFTNTVSSEWGAIFTNPFSYSDPNDNSFSNISAYYNDFSRLGAQQYALTNFYISVVLNGSQNFYGDIGPTDVSHVNKSCYDQRGVLISLNVDYSPWCQDSSCNNLLEENSCNGNYFGWYLIGGCVLGLSVLALCITLIVRWRNKRNNTFYSSNLTEKDELVFKPNLALLTKLNIRFIPLKDLKMKGILGNGASGSVWKGVWKNCRYVCSGD
eukprot:TRINITY_DN4370_c0_g1_i4.p1 TRINITY_DN4370_c0_g1~~TRINITY_DN4370_c0_g1_i4.p1  ORF type:complete len:388 (+),score=44.44 TRINITY_DN4370_c0_g1_i4:535-1698(+)